MSIALTTFEITQLHEYETAIERGLSTFMDVGEALLAIRDRRLYRAAYSTFEEYCQQRWGFTRQHGNRLIAAAETVRRLEPMGSIPASERQVRPLTQLEPDEQREAWRNALETAPGGNITAHHVQAAVDRHIDAKKGGNGHSAVLDGVYGPVIDEETGEILPSGKGNGNGRHLPQTNRAGNEEEPQSFDDCQTPPYALDPLLPFLDHNWIIWEPARGDGQLVDALYDGGYAEHQVVSSSIQDGQNFFKYEPECWDCLVTNPPYSIKYPWLERCYQLGKPFALLLPVTTLGAGRAQEMFNTYGVQVIFMDQRVDFKMPNMGYEGNGAQFSVAWFTWQLPLEREMVFASIKAAKKAFVDAL